MKSTTCENTVCRLRVCTRNISYVTVGAIKSQSLDMGVNGEEFGRRIDKITVYMKLLKRNSYFL